MCKHGVQRGLYFWATKPVSPCVFLWYVHKPCKLRISVFQPFLDNLEKRRKWAKIMWDLFIERSTSGNGCENGVAITDWIANHWLDCQSVELRRLASSLIVSISCWQHRTEHWAGQKKLSAVGSRAESFDERNSHFASSYRPENYSYRLSVRNISKIYWTIFIKL